METDGQPKLVIRYKEDQARNGLFIVLALSPVWAFWGLYVAFGLAQTLFTTGVSVQIICLLAFYLGLAALGLLTVAICLDNKFSATPYGLKLPKRFLLEMGFWRYRPWAHLDSVQFQNDELTLRFSRALPAGVAHFKLTGLKSNDLKDLVVAIRSNSPETRCIFDRKAVEMGIPGIQANPNGESFTSIWENELASRFGSTAFVPLEAHSKLQNGRLTVIGQVSFGGLSAIYLCKDAFGATCVLKEAVVPLNADAASKSKALEMFDREAQILQALSHSNIARVMDHFVENDRHYLLLEHLNGLDLRAYVKEHGAQPERLIIRWALEIADILDYLHNQSPPIIHRDVTPDNLVLDRTGSIKLIDFGAANEFIGTATGTLVGKQSYMAPEQFRGKAAPQSDIYSLGCTLFYIATGSDPEALSQSNLPEELAKKMADLDGLISKCTALELEDRFDSMRTVAESARQVLKSVQPGV